MREFSDLLDKILAAKTSISSLAVLDYATENVKLVAKIPYYMECKWRDKIEKSRANDGEVNYPSFKSFADFVRESADKANIPELDELHVPPSKTYTPKPKGKTPKGNTLATSAKSSEAEHAGSV